MSAPNDREAFQKWAQDQMQAMARHLMTAGVVVKDEVKVEARWHYPFRIMVAQAWGRRTPDEKFWLIGGDVPLDHVESRAATDARAALRHFALRWQVQGARIKSGDRDVTPEAKRSELRVNWSEIGDTLARNAEFVYALADDDRNWESTMRL
jgi:hypothetical protein